MIDESDFFTICSRVTFQESLEADMLNAKLKQRFQEDGYVMLEQAIDPNTLEALLAKLDQWVDDSRAECEP